MSWRDCKYFKSCYNVDMSRNRDPRAALCPTGAVSCAGEMGPRPMGGLRRLLGSHLRSWEVGTSPPQLLSHPLDDIMHFKYFAELLTTWHVLRNIENNNKL